MAHDNRSFSITRFDSSPSWHAAVMPASRRWVVYEDAHGFPHLYLRAEDIRDPRTGDTRERYRLVYTPADSVLERLPEAVVPHIDHLEALGWTCHSALQVEDAPRCVALVSRADGEVERWALARWPAGWPGDVALEESTDARTIFDRLEEQRDAADPRKIIEEAKRHLVLARGGTDVEGNDVNPDDHVAAALACLSRAEP